MRYRLMATYRGIPFEAGVGPTDADVVLFSPTPPGEELGFEPAAGHWRKRVSRDDIDELAEWRPVGLYRAKPCLVLEEIGDRLHITDLGHDAYAAERLGYWQVDRGVYEVVVPRDEVTELTEQRVEHPVRRGGSRTFPAPPEVTLAPESARPPAPAPPATSPAAPLRAATPPRGQPAAPAAPASEPPAPAGEPSRPAAVGESAEDHSPEWHAFEIPSRASRPDRPRWGGYESWNGSPGGEDTGAPGRGVGEQTAPPDRATGDEAILSPNGVATTGTGGGDATVAHDSAHEPGGPATAELEPPSTGREPAEGAPESGLPPPAGVHLSGVADVLSGAASREEPGDELSALGWAETLDRLPPPRPLPKRRRAESRPAPARGPDSADPAAAAPASPPAPAPSSRPADGAPLAPRPAAERLPGAPTAGSDGLAAPREPGGRRRRTRVETRWVFRELVDMAAIPHTSYAVDEEIDGALCLIKTDDGYEVFSPGGGVKHEVRFFEDEEAAYFYLFGVLAAEAIRSGQLVPSQADAGTGDAPHDH